MKRIIFRGFGIALVIWGIVLFSSSFSVTGLVVFEGLGKNVGSILGIVFVVVGILLMQFRPGGKIIRLYHASPPGAYRPGLPLNKKKVRHGGFYMASSQGEAIRAATEVNPNLDSDRLSVIEVDIPSSDYNSVAQQALGSSSHPYTVIPKSNFDTFNKLLEKGEIVTKRARPDLEDIAG